MEKNNEFPTESSGQDGIKPVLVQAILSHCSGDQRNKETNRFRLWTPVEIGPKNDIFLSGESCLVAKKIGLELLCLQQPRTCAVVATSTFSGAQLDNRVATFLMIDASSGFAAPKWQSNVGNVLFARKDKKGLTANHFEALWMFNDRFLDVFGNDAASARGMMTRRGWDQFWLGYRKEQIGIIQGCIDSGSHERQGEIDAWRSAINPLLM